jgi:hypothetical protein
MGKQNRRNGDFDFFDKLTPRLAAGRFFNDHSSPAQQEKPSHWGKDARCAYWAAEAWGKGEGNTASPDTKNRPPDEPPQIVRTAQSPGVRSKKIHPVMVTAKPPVPPQGGTEINLIKAPGCAAKDPIR